MVNFQFWYFSFLVKKKEKERRGDKRERKENKGETLKHFKKLLFTRIIRDNQ